MKLLKSRKTTRRAYGGNARYYKKEGRDYFVCYPGKDCFPLDDSEDIQRAKKYIQAQENASRPKSELLHRKNRVAHMTRNAKNMGMQTYNSAPQVPNYGGKRTRKQRKV